MEQWTNDDTDEGDPARPASDNFDASSVHDDPVNSLSSASANFGIHASDGRPTRQTLAQLRPVPPLADDSGIDRGFSSSRSAVHLWTDAKGMIHRVRLSSSWRSRVSTTNEPASLASGLSRAFGQAFLLTNIALREPPTIPDLFSDPPAGPTALSWEAISRLTADLDRLRAEQRERGPGGRGRWIGTNASGRGAQGRVILTLGPDGAYEDVTFDPQWLVASRVRLICAGVHEAAAAAKAAFVPPTFEPGPADLLDAQADELREELTAMMKRGF